MTWLPNDNTIDCCTAKHSTLHLSSVPTSPRYCNTETTGITSIHHSFGFSITNKSKNTNTTQFPPTENNYATANKQYACTCIVTWDTPRAKTHHRHKVGLWMDFTFVHCILQIDNLRVCFRETFSREQGTHVLERIANKYHEVTQVTVVAVP